MSIAGLVFCAVSVVLSIVLLRVPAVPREPARSSLLGIVRSSLRDAVHNLRTDRGFVVFLVGYSALVLVGAGLPVIVAATRLLATTPPRAALGLAGIAGGAGAFAAFVALSLAGSGFGFSSHSSSEPLPTLGIPLAIASFAAWSLALALDVPAAVRVWNALGPP